MNKKKEVLMHLMIFRENYSKLVNLLLISTSSILFGQLDVNQQYAIDIDGAVNLVSQSSANTLPLGG